MVAPNHKPVLAEPGELVVPRQVAADLIPALQKALAKVNDDNDKFPGIKGLDFRQYMVGSPEAKVDPDTGMEMFPLGYGGPGFPGAGPSRENEFGGTRSAGGDNPIVEPQKQFPSPIGPSGFGVDVEPALVEMANAKLNESMLGAGVTHTPGLLNLARFAGEQIGGVGAAFDPLSQVGGLSDPALAGATAAGGSRQAGRDPFLAAATAQQGEDPVLGPSIAAPPVATGQRPLTRPGALTAPGNLGLGGLSPLQQRSAIATEGIFGDQRFRGQEAIDFYKNILARSFIDDAGGLTGESLLPVEQQFVRSVLGGDPSNVEALLRTFQ